MKYSLMAIAMISVLAGCAPTDDVAIQPIPTEPVVDEVMPVDNEVESDSSDYVWFSIPEIGVRYKVTPDAAEELRYFTEVDERDGSTSAVVYIESLNDTLNCDKCETLYYLNAGKKLTPQERESKGLQPESRLAIFLEDETRIISGEKSTSVRTTDGAGKAWFLKKEADGINFGAILPNKNTLPRDLEDGNFFGMEFL